MRKLLKLFSALLFLSVMSMAVSPANSTEVPLTFTLGPSVGGTQVFEASLAGLGLTQIGSITVIDDGTPFGGSPGVFSGFDVDAIFLDVDGNIATTADRYFASSYIFSAGTTRFTSDPTMLPTAAHPGPTFGSLNSTTIDYATATLNTIDGVAVADVNVANGFLTLGDGGSLIVNFSPEVGIASTLFLLTGEVGYQTGEGLGASVKVSDVQVPEPATLLLLVSGLIGLAGLKRKFNK
jgi:hypothetical protein